MTQVDFHILSSDGLDILYLHACRLAEKAWRNGHRVYLHCPNEAVSSHLDELLWGFRPDAFVSHSRLADNPRDTVVIGHGEDPGQNHEVMINLDPSRIPEHFSRFERVFEVVGSDGAQKQNGREKWRFYQHRGYPLHKHDIA